MSLSSGSRMTTKSLRALVPSRCSAACQQAWSSSSASTRCARTFSWSPLTFTLCSMAREAPSCRPLRLLALRCQRGGMVNALLQQSLQEVQASTPAAGIASYAEQIPVLVRLRNSDVSLEAWPLRYTV